MLVLLIVLLIACATFRTMQASDSERLLSTVGSILRNESMIANTYALSKSLSDIESLGLIDCAQVRESNTADRLFYDTSTNRRCYIGSWLEKLRTVSTEITSINGTSYMVKIQPKLDLSKILLEILVYLIIMLSFRQINKAILRNRHIAEARIQAIEIEKQMMLDHTRQIRHDVASPLTAINTIVRLIPKMDPELKSVLMLAIERTQSLFNDLNKPTTAQAIESIMQEFGIKTDALPLVEQILAEKRSVWAERAEIITANSLVEATPVAAEENALIRILSNILNNAYEACNEVETPKVLVEVRSTLSHVFIEITDNGKGISTENLQRIGAKGLSIGKEGHATAGSGLGIYNAIQTLKEWSGELKISSIEGSGTSVTVILKRALEAASLPRAFPLRS
jgi:signal transduction histidine kinase